MVEITELTDSYRESIIALLESGDLRSEYVLEEGTRYWGAFVCGELIGVIGCEFEGGYALLRSAYVAEKYRGQGIAARLTETVFEAAKESGVKAVYLFSTDAGEYWIKRGFYEIPVAEVTEKLPRCPQVKLFEELGWLPTEVTYKYDIE